MQKKKMNPWSMVAILCAAGFCPLFTVAAVLLGFRALVDIKARRDTRGIRLAWAAIIIGSLVTGFWGGGMLWWNVNVRARIEQGPIEALLDGQEGDIAAFESAFIVLPPDSDAVGFLKEVRDRYGILEHGEMDQEIEESPVDGSQLFLGMVPFVAELEYICYFEHGKSVKLTGKFELFHDEDDGSKRFVNRFAWIRIHDEVNGDLVYPAQKRVEELLLFGE